MYSLKRSFKSAITTIAPSVKNVSIIGTPPENDCLRFQFADPHQDKGTLPVPLQKCLVRGLRDVK